MHVGSTSGDLNREVPWKVLGSIPGSAAKLDSVVKLVNTSGAENLVMKSNARSLASSQKVAKSVGSTPITSSKPRNTCST